VFICVKDKKAGVGVKEFPITEGTDAVDEKTNKWLDL
jgi:hypothetical protein